MAAARDLEQRVRADPERLGRIGKVELRPDRAHAQGAGQPPLAQTRIDQRRFPTRVGADQEACIRLLDPGDRSVE
jgi:hypothetical protein